MKVDFADRCGLSKVAGRRGVGGRKEAIASPLYVRGPHSFLVVDHCIVAGVIPRLV